MRVFITKYALTQGILQIEVEQLSKTMVREGSPSSYNFAPSYYHGEGKEWHRTYESALERAEEMKKKRISSLKGQLKRIKELSFESPENEKTEDTSAPDQKTKGKGIL